MNRLTIQVIFCHQEDVNWPLGDSLSLKKKLDDIFASTRYSKALDTIKKTKKDVSQQLAEHDKELAVVEAEKSQATKMKKEADTEVFKLQKLKDKIEELDKNLEEVNEQIEKYESVIEKVNSVKKNLTEKEAQRKIFQKDVDEIYNSLEQEFTETDEEVKQFEANFNKQLEQLKQSQKKAETEFAQSETKKKSLNQETNNLKEELGKLRSLKESHENRLQDLSTEIYALAQRYQISGYDHPPYSETQTLDFVGKIQQQYEKARKEYEKKKYENRTQQDALNNESNTCQQKKETLSKQIKTLEQKYNMLQKEENEIKEKIRKITITESAVATMEQDFNKIQGDLKTMEERNEAAQIKKEIELTSNNQKEITSKITNLTKELASREKEKDISFKIQNLKEEYSKHSIALEEKFKEVKEKYEQTLGHADFDTNTSNIEAKIKTLIHSKSDKVQQLSRSIQTVEKNVSVLKSKIETFATQEKKIKQQIESKESAVAGVLPAGKTWEEAMKEAEEAVTDLRNEVSMTEALKMCYENFVRHARNRHECPVCERGLNSEECTTFEGLQMSKLEQTPKHLQKKKAKLQTAEAVLEKIREIKPVISEIDKLKTRDLVEVERESSKLKEENQKLASSIDELSEELSSAKSEEKKANELLNVSGEIKVVQTTVKTTQTRLLEQENELKKLGLGVDLVPYEQIKKELDDAQTSREKLAQKYQTLQQDLTKHQNDLSKMKDEVREKQTKLQRAQYELKELERNNESLSAKEKESKQTLSEIEKIKQDIPNLTEQFQSLSKSLSEMKEKHRQEELIIEGTISDYQREISTINASSIEIKKYKDRGVEDLLQTTEMKMDKLNVQIDENTKQSESLTEQLKKYNKMLEKQNVIKQNIEINLKYRTKKKELEKLIQECETLNKEITKMTGSEQASLDTYQDIKILKEKQGKYSNEKAQIAGMRSTIKGRVKTIAEELSSDQFKDIENKHRSLLIKMMTTKHAVEDLEKYSKALEKALTKYHSMKMAEINELIKELWQKTYRGNDIDTICIKCDAETDSGKKTYNYRVVMVKGDVELQMRGRSSAGQKVLACLVIRLALAEAFSIDCGILALDEPTTNLDLDNVNSLAESLRFLIEDRKKMTNFQLIVITHDEDFVRKLGRGEFVENYYRISKDPRLGGSLIEQQKIVE